MHPSIYSVKFTLVGHMCLCCVAVWAGARGPSHAFIQVLSMSCDTQQTSADPNPTLQGLGCRSCCPCMHICDNADQLV